MGTVMSNYIHANATHNEKNLCRLFMAMRPTGPVAVAFAEIYLLLNRLAPGQTVKTYCQNVLGYDTKTYENTFTSDEQEILDGHWDPKFKDVSLLFKLLRRVCGLSQDGRDWEEPAYPLEFHLHTARNEIDDAMYDKIDVTDEDLHSIFQELDNSISSAIHLAGGRVGRNVHYLVQKFKSDLHICLNMNFEEGFVARIQGHPNSKLSYVSAIAMLLLYRYYSSGNGDGVSLTTLDPGASLTADVTNASLSAAVSGVSLTAVVPGASLTAVVPGASLTAVAPGALRTAYASLSTGSAATSLKVVAPGIMFLAKVTFNALLATVACDASLARAVGAAASLADTATAGKLSNAIRYYNGSPSNTSGVNDIISLIAVTAAAPLMYLGVKYYRYTQIRTELRKYLHEAEASELNAMSTIIQRQLKRLYLKKNVIK